MDQDGGILRGNVQNEKVVGGLECAQLRADLLSVQPAAEVGSFGIQQCIADLVPGAVCAAVGALEVQHDGRSSLKMLEEEQLEGRRVLVLSLGQLGRKCQVVEQGLLKLVAETSFTRLAGRHGGHGRGVTTTETDDWHASISE